MKKKHRNEEARNVLDIKIADTLLFYLNEYREDADKWGEAFKQEFCGMIDTFVEEIKEEED